MPVSMNKTPVIKGKYAKKILDSYENPVDNSELFEKCKEASKLFKLEDDPVLKKLYESGKRLSELLNISEEDINKVLKQLREECWKENE